MNEIMRAWDEKFDANLRLAGQSADSNGYHTRVPIGTLVHSTRDNLDYAFGLLASGAERHARALEVIDAVLRMQDVSPISPTYGIWPWFAEEPLAEMAPPDWNWADFCGARLAEILKFHADKLAPELLARVRAALGHAAWSIFRRNMHPGYTNIAIMGAVVAAAAGELLDEPRLLDYGRARWAAFVAHTKRHGSFNEYNSPTYTAIAIMECERALRLCRDAAVRADAEATRRKGWEIVAAHHHAPTGQWGGPHSRAYSDRLTASSLEWLRQRLDPGAGEIACPAELLPAFAGLDGETWARHVYCVDANGNPEMIGSVWRHPSGCLGSVNRDTFWAQRRPAIGYWRAGDGGVAVFRARFLKDGIDFASAVCHTEQDRGRLLLSASWALDQGDFHCGLDRPEQPVFAGETWTLRFSVDAADATVAESGAGFSLASGDMRVDVAPAADCLFDGRPVLWRCGGGDGLAWVDAVCHEGSPLSLNLKTSPRPRVAAGCRLARRDAPPSADRPAVFAPETPGKVVWGDLSLDNQSERK